MKKKQPLTIYYQKQFKKDFKKIQKSGKKLDKLKIVIDLLLMQKKLPLKYDDHKLSGDYIGWRECHVNPNLLLIYRFDLENHRLELVRLGSHSDLFK